MPWNLSVAGLQGDIKIMEIIYYKIYMINCVERTKDLFGLAF